MSRKKKRKEKKKSAKRLIQPAKLQNLGKVILIPWRKKEKDWSKCNPLGRNGSGYKISKI